MRDAFSVCFLLASHNEPLNNKGNRVKLFYFSSETFQLFFRLHVNLNPQLFCFVSNQK